MKSLATLIKLQKTKVDEQRIILMKMQEQLEIICGKIQALIEEQAQQKKLIHQEPSLALTYGEYVKVALKKMEELEKRKRAAEIAVSLAHDKLAEVFEEQKRYELAEKNRLEEEEREEQRRETHVLDEVGSISFTRKMKRKKK